MHISRPQHRPPRDMSNPMLQVSDGCTHGKCRFCDIYNGIPFTVSPMEEVVEDIEELSRQTMAHKHRIYLTGGNPYALSNRRLMDIFDAVERRMPQINSYGGFCRIMDIAAKSDEELEQLAARGVDDLTVGAESGYAPVLEFMDKGQTPGDIVEQTQRLHKAGITCTFFYLAGLAGEGKGQENALASARVFSSAAPETILIVTLTPTKTWRLKECIEAGTWRPASEVETANEIRTFIANLTCACSVICSHDTDIIRFDGVVPADQENMLKLMDARIPKLNERSARRMREMIHKASF